MSKTPGGDSGNGSLLCSRRFRLMLRCVERTGSSTACTEQINDFLACERSVFLAALNAKPGGDALQSAAERKTSPHTTPPPRHPRGPEPDSELARQAWSLSDLGEILSKAVAKQAEACSKLVETAGKPESRANLSEFGDRMVADMGKTLAVVRDLISRTIAQDDDGSDKSHRDDGDDAGHA